MKEIILSQGKVALVDDDDYEYLNQWKWYTKRCGHLFYAVRNVRICKNRQRQIQMHRLIMNTPIGLTVDHIDHDGLNNQKTNLRNCTMKENSMNKSKNKGFSTKYKGVYVFRNKFAVNIRVDDKIIFLGVFDNAVDGAREYDKAAIKYFGEFAHLNFPKEDYL